MEVTKNGKTLYHIQNMNIYTDGTPYDEFVFCDHWPTKDDLHKLFLDTFEDNPIDSNEQLDELLTSSQIYKLYAEEL